MGLISTKQRKENIQRLVDFRYEILIIGGGITGAGIALDAVSRGFKVALVEQADFASGTSSRSTKLIHGGLRYLKQGDFKLVRETAKERTIILNNAPHLIHRKKLILPFTKGGNLGWLSTKIGLTIYDFIAGSHNGERHKMLSKGKVLEIEPSLKNELLKSGAIYSEYRTDDARLTIEILKTAASKGALTLNYISAENFIIREGKVVGINCIDKTTDEKFSVFADVIINATGPWVDEIRNKIEDIKGNKIRHTKGIHLVFNQRDFPLCNAVYFDAPDKRMIFAIPREKTVYLGTTDTNYTDDLSAPSVKAEDAEYLIDAANRIFPDFNLTKNKIISSWAGIRPLIDQPGKKPSEISRKDEMFISSLGLISIAGGKLTGYRLMAKKVMDHVCELLKVNQPCRTDKLILNGGRFKGKEFIPAYIKTVKQRLKTLGLDGSKAEYLVNTYGKQCDEILDIARNYDENQLIKAEAYFSLTEEGCIHLTDFFIRRTGMLYFAPNEIEPQLDAVAEVFSEYNKWNKTTCNKEKKAVLKELNNTITFAK
ncbi:MAG: glycerol-3-phosphate dehydrogenase/oxidase [Flavobacteriales bacterium]